MRINGKGVKEPHCSVGMLQRQGKAGKVSTVGANQAA